MPRAEANGFPLCWSYWKSSETRSHGQQEKRTVSGMVAFWLAVRKMAMKLRKVAVAKVQCRCTITAYLIAPRNL